MESDNKNYRNKINQRWLMKLINDTARSLLSSVFISLKPVLDLFIINFVWTIEIN